MIPPRWICAIVGLVLAACTPPTPSPSALDRSAALPTPSIGSQGICDPSTTPILVAPQGDQVVLGDGPAGTSTWLDDDGMRYFLRQVGDCVWIIGYVPRGTPEPPFLTTFHGRISADLRIVGTFSDNTGALIPGYDTGELAFLVTFEDADVVLVEDRTDSGPAGCFGGTGPCPDPRELRRLEDLRIESRGFEPAFTAILPHGWSYEPQGFLPKNPESRNVGILRDWVVMSATCELEPEPGVGPSVDDQVTALANRDGLVVTGPQAVSMAGLSGQQLDLALAADWMGACPWTLGEPTVPLIGKFDPEDEGFIAAFPDERYRLVLLDVPGGGIVTILIFSTGGADFESHLAESMAILESLEFDVP